MNTNEFDTVFAKPMKRAITVDLYSASDNVDNVLNGMAEPVDTRRLRAYHKIEKSKYFGNQLRLMIELSEVGSRNKMYNRVYWAKDAEVVKDLGNECLVRLVNTNRESECYLVIVPKA